MPSKEFTNLHFNTIGFTGKWLDFIGDPAPGFTAMVFGMPKMGKSYLCIDFAGYLARNHGKVLYVAKEEKLDATLQKKLKDKDEMMPKMMEVTEENISVEILSKNTGEKLTQDKVFFEISSASDQIPNVEFDLLQQEIPSEKTTITANTKTTVSSNEHKKAGQCHISTV